MSLLSLSTKPHLLPVVESSEEGFSSLFCNLGTEPFVLSLNTISSEESRGHLGLNGILTLEQVVDFITHSCLLVVLSFPADLFFLCYAALHNSCE